MGCSVVGTTHYGPTRFGTCDADEDQYIKSKPFVYNKRFRVTKGKEFFAGGRILFPEPKTFKSDKTYKTRFFANVPHNGKIYRRNNHNLSLAIKHRLMACRQPPDGVGHLEYESYLRANQARQVDHYLPSFSELSRIYETNEYKTTLEESCEHYADPHQKKILRVQFHNEAIETGGYGEENFTSRRKVNLKFKTNEIGKPKKVGRVIGDLGVAMSMVGFRSTLFLKAACEQNDLQTTIGTCTFCKSPDTNSLTRVFNNLINPPKTFYLSYFSDDACLSYRYRGKIHMMNVDISSCDASHSSIFKCLRALTPPALLSSIDDLLKQLEYGVTIVSDYKKDKIVGSFKGPTLFSGSTLTTMLNNCVYLLFGMYLQDHPFSEDPSVTDPISTQLKKRFEQIGYIITVEECDIPQKLQFLKHSPVYDTNGELQPLLNLGVLLRASGTCNGDIPGKQPFIERAHSFQHSLLHGMYPRVHFNLIDNMKSVAKRYFHVDTSSYTTKSAVDNEFSVDDTQVYLRYGLTPTEITQINDVYGHSGFGDYTCLTGLDKILQLDYGLSLNWFEPILDLENQNNQMGVYDKR
jgi:hypothetical protein